MLSGSVTLFYVNMIFGVSNVLLCVYFALFFRVTTTIPLNTNNISPPYETWFSAVLGFPPPVPPPACARTRCMRPRPRASLLVNPNRVQRRRAECLDVSRCVPVPLHQQDLCGPSQREAPPSDRERTPLTP